MMEASPSVDAESVRVVLIEDLGQQRLPARLCQAILAREGVHARLIDFRSAADIPTIVELVQELEPALVVCSLLFAYRLDEHLALLSALRESGAGAHLTITGHLIGLAPKLFLDACHALDSVICGEPEASLVELVRWLENGRPAITVPGLMPRDQDGPVAPPGVPDLDALPLPAYDEGIPFRTLPQGAASQKEVTGYGFVTVEASRGCDHACTFCGASAFYRRARLSYRSKSVSRLVDEIYALYERGARLFLFDDEQFLPPERVQSSGEYVSSLREELVRRNLQIAFTVKCRADDVERRLFGDLASIGLIRTYVGIESGAPASLASFFKRTTPGENLAALHTLSDLGVVADFRILIIHPWSTLETVEEDLAFLEQALPLLPTLVTFQEIEVYPGTPMAARLRVPPSILPGYTVADPRVQFLRQLNHLVFGSGSRHARLDWALTQAWFDHLVMRRLCAPPSNSTRSAELRAIALEANRAALATWHEMLAFAEGEQTRDVSAIRARAGEWTWGMNSSEEALLEQLGKL